MTNVFEEMEKNNATPTEPAQQPPVAVAGEVDYNALSNKAVGETYTRQDLDGKTVTILKATLFNADTKEPVIEALKDKTKKYHKCNFIVYYDTENQDREYMSGIIQFVQKDGTLSPHQFWYEGAENQVAHLWEAVASAKNVKPEDLSPREFLAFLNNKPKALIKKQSFKNVANGGTVNKNMIDKFIL
jgi:hypothetical protein